MRDHQVGGVKSRLSGAWGSRGSRTHRGAGTVAKQPCANRRGGHGYDLRRAHNLWPLAQSGAVRPGDHVPEACTRVERGAFPKRGRGEGAIMEKLFSRSDDANVDVTMH